MMQGLAQVDDEDFSAGQTVFRTVAATLRPSRPLLWRCTSPVTHASIDKLTEQGTAPRLAHDAQAGALDRVVHAPDLMVRNRLAAILVLVFAQPIERIVNLRWDDITLTHDAVVVNVAGILIRFNDPIDAPVRELAANPQHARTAAHPDSPWVFRGTMPGAHITAMHLRQELRPLFSSLAARLGTLTELGRQTPVAILAEALGYKPETLEKHAAASGADYGRYVADLAR